MDILDLLRQDGITPRRKASTRGGEYSSPCPFCGGTDRFLAWPKQETKCGGGTWWCRQCGKGGDRIEYLKLVRGLSYPEACDHLGLRPRKRRALDWAAKSERNPGAGCSWVPRDTREPARGWRKEAAALVDWAMQRLYEEPDHCTIEWLRSARSLRDETWKRHRLGLVTVDLFKDRGYWGLPQEIKPNGKAKKLWIPEGLTIPLFDNDDNVLRIRIRRWEEEPRYYLIPGGDTRPMLLGGDRPVIVVVESELDAMLIEQEAQDLVGVLALGNSGARPDQRAADSLNHAQRILVALDADEAGAKSAWQWWLTHFPRAERFPPVGGKDPSEMELKGVSVRDWIRAWLIDE